MGKILKLNEDLIDDETNPELLDQMRTIANDLHETLMQFKAIAKAKGMRYKIAVSKKDALDAKIAGKSASEDQLTSQRETLEANESSGAEVDTNLKDEKRNTEVQNTVESNDKPKSMDSKQSAIDDAEKHTEQSIEGSRDANMKVVQDGDGISPEAFSEDGDASDEEDPRYMAVNKHKLLEWVTEADFSKDLQLHKIAHHRFQLDSEEKQALIGTEGILKICKVMMYKIGLTYKRMDIHYNELREEF